MRIEEFSPQSRVWIYQSDRPFTEEEIIWLNKELEVFVEGWTSHDVRLNGYGKVLEDRFIILMVDETHTSAGGCSIDASMIFMKKLASHLKVDLFNRFLFSYIKDGRIVTHSVSDAASLVHDGDIKEDTIIFNCLVLTKAEFDQNFKTTFANSWLKQYIN